MIRSREPVAIQMYSKIGASSPVLTGEEMSGSFGSVGTSVSFTVWLLALMSSWLVTSTSFSFRGNYFSINQQKFAIFLIHEGAGQFVFFPRNQMLVSNGIYNR